MGDLKSIREIIDQLQAEDRNAEEWWRETVARLNVAGLNEESIPRKKVESVGLLKSKKTKRLGK